MKQKTGRKLLSVLLSLALVLGLMPGMSLVALAGDATNWTATDSLPTSAGNYKLDGDVTLSNTWTVPSGETTLDLNGHKIEMNGNYSVITVNSGAILTLQDSSSSGDGCVTGGKGTLVERVKYGGGVYVNGGTLNMTGGKIESNAANGEQAGYGGGVYLNGGSFTLTGGEIKNNTAGGQAAGYGGGVGCGGSSTFEMSGSASISDNAADHSGGGGGVLLSASTFTMKGGTISGNTASIYNGVLVNVGSTLNRQGGTIDGAVGSSYGGGYIKYGVIFDANGHGAAPAVQNVEYDGKATKPENPTENGYVFGGWYKEQGCTNEWNFDTDTVTAATTLYAKWTPVEATAPTINSVAGAALTFGYTEGSVSVSATAATDTTYSLTYQWYSNTTNSTEGGTAITENGTSATYTIPIGKTAGTTEYYYCVVTATRSDNGQTATATSSVATVSVSAADPATPTNLTATYGQTLADVTLPTNWAWADETTTSVGNAGTNTFKANYTAPNANYNSKTDVDVEVTVEKANAVAATVSANNRTYDGTEKPLVTVDNSTLMGGEMQYALGTETEATEQYTTSIPTATDAGTYTVWYKVVGDANHKDAAPASVDVSIAPAYTVTLTGGANATRSGGANEQTVSVGNAMTTVTFTPDDGYTFAGFETVEQNGVTAVLVGDSIEVSGTPTGNVSITIPDAALPPVASVTVGETVTEYTDFADAVSAWNSAANGATLKLLSDVTTTSSINVVSTKTLDLNGHGIKPTGTGYSVITVVSGASLTLNDSAPNAPHKYTIQNPKSNGAGLAVVDDSSGSQTFYGGYITGGNAAFGGGVLVDNATFTMNGGTIIGNKAEGGSSGWNGGGGVMVRNANGVFTMNGGAIIGNTTMCGGALSVTDASCATITGGEMKYNYSTGNGGAINTNGNSSTAKITMSGGSITNNWTQGNSYGQGGGVLLDNTILTLSGNPKITDNVCGDGKNNVYYKGQPRDKIDLSAALSDDAKIGVTMRNPGVFTGSTQTNYNDASKFTSDNSSYAVRKNADGQLYLGAPFTVTLSGGANAAATGGATTQSVVGEMTAVTYTPNDGYHFDSFVAITSNGVTAEFDEGSVVVSGTPTDDATLTIPDAVANDVPFVPTFRTQSLVLSGQIGVNFFMDLSGLTPEQRNASYMEFTVSGKGGTTTTDGFDAGHTSKNGLYYGFTCYVNSIQMADTITAVYHYNDGGEQTVEKEYSVKAYLDAIQGLTQNEKMRSLAVAMGDYGYYAQQYLSQLRSFTLGVDYTAMPEGTAYTEDIITAAKTGVAGYTVSYDLDGTGIEKLSYSLLLDSSTGIYIYLTPSAEYTGSVTAVIGDGEDNVAELQNDGRWRIHIADISTHRLGETYTVTVTAGAEFTITLSALSYARTMLNYDGGTAKEQRDNAMVSLYRFYDSAMNYAGRAH